MSSTCSLMRSSSRVALASASPGLFNTLRSNALTGLARPARVIVCRNQLPCQRRQRHDQRQPNDQHRVEQQVETDKLARRCTATHPAAGPHGATTAKRPSRPTRGQQGCRARPAAPCHAGYGSAIRAISPLPALAPSTSGSPASSGSTPCAQNVANIRTAATLE